MNDTILAILTIIIIVGLSAYLFWYIVDKWIN